MSAAATAAGYLYASGRLRGRGAKGEGEQQQPEQPRPPKAEKERERAPRGEVRVAVYEPQERPKRTPKIQYRTRRWKPDEPHGG
jgi:hypothetical protein